MKHIFRILLPLATLGVFAESNAVAQSFFSNRNVSMPGLGTDPNETKVEGNFAFRTSEQHVEVDSGVNLKTSTSWALDFNAGLKPKGNGAGKYVEFDFGVSLGGTDVVGQDTFTSLEIGGSIVGKYEIEVTNGQRLVPFARLGVNFNGINNYQETTVGYGNFYYNRYNSTLYYNRYYYSSGDVYLDLYGAASVGLSYIFADNKVALSSEVGTWDSLVGDLKDQFSGGSKYFWSSQAFFKISDRVGIKAFYSMSSMNDLGGYSGVRAVNSTLGLSLAFGF